MKNSIEMNEIVQTFDNLKQLDEETGLFYWNASDLQKIYGYKRWEKFNPLIKRVIKKLIYEGANINNYIEYSKKIVTSGFNKKEKIQDYKCTFEFCEELAMDGDTRKRELQLIKIYFRQKTRQLLKLTTNKKNLLE